MSASLQSALQLKGYQLSTLLKAGGNAALHLGNAGTKSLLFKVANAGKNPLLTKEVKLIGSIRSSFDAANPDAILEGGRHADYFPRLVDSLEVDSLVVNVFEYDKTAVTLADVRDAYPDGIDPRDAAWMFNRLLEALHLLHSQDYVHGAILPHHFMIIPKTHEGFLVDFTHAVKQGNELDGRPLKKLWLYPEEIVKGEPVDFSTDIAMAANVFTSLVDKVPPEIQHVLNACTLGRAHRVQYAEDVYKEMKQVLRRLYGPKTFRPFSMNSVTLPLTAAANPVSSLSPTSTT